MEDKGNSDFDSYDEEIRSADLHQGDRVEFSYMPDRRVEMVYLGDNRYRVEQSDNSKLLPGDEAEVHHFVLHHPLLAMQVWRGGKTLGQFTAGRVSGLSSIKML